MNRVFRTSLLLAAAMAAGAMKASALERIHRVAARESFQDIARAYWGRPDWGDLLRTHNGLPPGSAAPGTSLRVPLPTEVRTSTGDTWASLARSELGDDALGPMVAALNGRSPSEAAPLPGQVVRIPALAVHQLGRGETLAALSRRFLADGELWPQLARLNRIDKPHGLYAGTRLRVPLLPGEPRRESPPPAKAREPELPPVGEGLGDRRGLPDEARERLEAGVSAYREGRYEEAREALEGARPAVLAGGSRQERIELLEHLIFVRVAFEDTAAACDAYGELLEVDPDHEWDDVRVSPKISRTTLLCEGQ
jgi:hypothetical protein